MIARIVLLLGTGFFAFNDVMARDFVLMVWVAKNFVVILSAVLLWKLLDTMHPRYPYHRAEVADYEMSKRQNLMKVVIYSVLGFIGFLFILEYQESVTEFIVSLWEQGKAYAYSF